MFQFVTVYVNTGSDKNPLCVCVYVYVCVCVCVWKIFLLCFLKSRINIFQPHSELQLTDYLTQTKATYNSRKVTYHAIQKV